MTLNATTWKFILGIGAAIAVLVFLLNGMMNATLAFVLWAIIVVALL